MENEKKSNGTLVGILIGLVIALLVVGGLFATGTIGFKKSTTNDNGKASNTNSNESNNILTENESLTILKEKYNVAREVFDLGMISYCGEVSNDDNSSKNIDGVLFTKSSTFSSYEELSNYLKKHMTEELLNSIVSYNDSVSKSYYEENGNLYCSTRNKGSDVNYTHFLENESTFKINQITENNITATITAIYYDFYKTEKNSRTINLSLLKESNNWLVNSYEDVTKY